MFAQREVRCASRAASGALCRRLGTGISDGIMSILESVGSFWFALRIGVMRRRGRAATLWRSGLLVLPCKVPRVGIGLGVWAYAEMEAFWGEIV